VPDDVRRAAERIAGLARRTPVIGSRSLDSLTGGTVVCKAESLQRTGSFKVRGAANRILALAQQELSRGLLAASSGNHAQAVAAVAAELGVEATILMPGDAPANKRAATEGYGARVITYDRYDQDREDLATRLAQERGLVQVPAFDDPWVMAGQGTVALELIGEVGDLDTLVVPVGGGGLMAGCGTIARDLCPGVELVGVEPAAGDDTRQSLAQGRRIRIPVPRTIADGQQADTPGRLTFEVNRRQVDRIEVVTDAQVVAAMMFAFDRLKLVLEPSGATALAAVLAGGSRLAGRRVGVVLSGGNVSRERFEALVRNLGA
jgi:threonine dehydratase